MFNFVKKKKNTKNKRKSTKLNEQNIVCGGGGKW